MSNMFLLKLVCVLFVCGYASGDDQYAVVGDYVSVILNKCEYPINWYVNGGKRVSNFSFYTFKQLIIRSIVPPRFFRYRRVNSPKWTKRTYIGCSTKNTSKANSSLLSTKFSYRTVASSIAGMDLLEYVSTWSICSNIRRLNRTTKKSVILWMSLIAVISNSSANSATLCHPFRTFCRSLFRGRFIAKNTYGKDQEI